MCERSEHENFSRFSVGNSSFLPPFLGRFHSKNLPIVFDATVGPRARNRLFPPFMSWGTRIRGPLKNLYIPIYIYICMSDNGIPLTRMKLGALIVGVKILC